MFVLGIGHKARHGKNLAAKTIIQHCATKGIYAREFGFCDALKAYCRVLGMREKNGRLLQVVGTDVFRAIDENIWVRILIDTIQEQQPDVAVITDMRFPNEVAAIKAIGGKAMKVSRYRADGSLWLTPDRDPHHSSETALDDFDGWDEHLVCADGAIGSFKRLAIKAFDNLYSPCAPI